MGARTGYHWTQMRAPLRPILGDPEILKFKRYQLDTRILLWRQEFSVRLVGILTVVGSLLWGFILTGHLMSAIEEFL